MVEVKGYILTTLLCIDSDSCTVCLDLSMVLSPTVFHLPYLLKQNKTNKKQWMHLGASSDYKHC